MTTPIQNTAKLLSNMGHIPTYLLYKHIVADDSWTLENSYLLDAFRSIMVHILNPGFSITSRCHSSNLQFQMFYLLNKLCKLLCYISPRSWKPEVEQWQSIVNMIIKQRFKQNWTIFTFAKKKLTWITDHFRAKVPGQQKCERALTWNASSFSPARCFSSSIAERRGHERAASTEQIVKSHPKPSPLDTIRPKYLHRK